ncbi:MAG: 30S ribosome-binding factor RbfA [Chloroflexi bacterium]|nr:30S ribosome-binding factor RbfA [Chloroflexota bacterium]
MAGHRSERVGERIHQEISLMLDRELADPRLANVNVTRVEVTGDLRLAKVYVTPRAADGDEKEMLDGLAHASGYIRRQLARALDLHLAPELRFYKDRAIEAGERFCKVLEKVQAEERAPAPKRDRWGK